MTDGEIIEMAREAGWEMDDSLVLEPEIVWYICQGQLQTFAKLVAQHEREACANIVELNADACRSDGVAQMILKSNAEAIRARGEE